MPNIYHGCTDQKGVWFMKKMFGKIAAMALISILVFVESLSFSTTVHAADNQNSITERSQDEKDTLVATLLELFPEQATVIEQYASGAINPDIKNPEIVYNETKSMNDTDYTLTVYNKVRYYWLSL